MAPPELVTKAILDGLDETARQMEQKWGVGQRASPRGPFRLARDERDAWVNWPARVAAMIAAELEVDPHQLHTVLERHVRDHLGELGEVRPNLR
jgi:hypothetical protein